MVAACDRAGRNAADLTAAVAPGIADPVFGKNLNPTNVATSQIPLPTAIGRVLPDGPTACHPDVVRLAGPDQRPIASVHRGRVPMTLYTPGGVSDDYYLNLLPGARPSFTVERPAR